MIDVIVAAYNAQEHIQACLESILGQTYPEIRIIIVDDGSTDRTAAVCTNLAEIHPGISLISQTNAGPGAARNTGLDESYSDFVTFVDADDLLAPQWLENLHSAAQRTDAGITTGQFVEFTSCTPPVFPRAEESECYVLTGQNAFREYVGAAEQNRLHTVVWDKLYRRDALKRLRFPTDKYAEDGYFTYRALYESTAVAITHSVGYAYRKSAQSESTQASSDRILTCFDDWREIHRFGVRHGAGVSTITGLKYFRKFLTTYKLAKVNPHWPGGEKVVSEILRDIAVNFSFFNSLPLLKRERLALWSLRTRSLILGG